MFNEIRKTEEFLDFLTLSRSILSTAKAFEEFYGNTSFFPIRTIYFFIPLKQFYLLLYLYPCILLIRFIYLGMCIFFKNYSFPSIVPTLLMYLHLYLFKALIRREFEMRSNFDRRGYRITGPPRSRKSRS